jgi:hypothetical protein
MTRPDKLGERAIELEPNSETERQVPGWANCISGKKTAKVQSIQMLVRFYPSIRISMLIRCDL